MKIDGGKRLVGQDFESKDRALIDKLGTVLNPFTEQVTQGFRKNLTVADNLNDEYKTFVLSVDINGIPTTVASFQTIVTGKVSGIPVVRAINNTNVNVYPTGAPFISFSQNSNILQIQHITGLTAGDKWSLTLRILGN